MNAAAMQRSLQALAQAGMWLDPIAKEKAAYVRGDIEIEEFERRVEELLAVPPRPVEKITHTPSQRSLV